MLFHRDPMHRPWESGLIFAPLPEQGGAAATPNPHFQFLGLRHRTGRGTGSVGSGSCRAWAATHKLWEYLWIKLIEPTPEIVNFFIHQNFHDILYDIPQSGLSPNKPEYPSRFSAGRKVLWKEKHPKNSQSQANIFFLLTFTFIKKNKCTLKSRFLILNWGITGRCANLNISYRARLNGLKLLILPSESFICIVWAGAKQNSLSRYFFLKDLNLQMINNRVISRMTVINTRLSWRLLIHLSWG